jgi:hypothetical protein
MARPLPHHLLAALLLVALLAGCGGAPPPGKFPELSWKHLPPIKLKVEKIEIVREYQPRVTSPHVETLAPRGLADSAERWAKDRLVADGDEGTARFVITDASLVEARAASPQERRYVGHVAVRLEIHDQRGTLDGQAAAEATNTRSVAREVSDSDVREAWYLIVQGAMLDLNAELDRNIRFYLPRAVEE